MKFLYCFVTTCKNSSNKTPNKFFFKVPFNNREAWCKAAGRSDVPTSSLDIREDHINVEEDIENYTRCFRISAKPEISLFRFESRIDSTNKKWGSNCNQKNILISPSVQCDVSLKHSSTQVQILMVDQAVNTILRKKQTLPCQVEDISTEDEQIPSTQGSTVEISGQETNTDSTLKENVAPLVLDFKKSVEKSPQRYLGFPKNYFWLINYISNDTKIPRLHVITVLFKLKHADPFYKIADLFNLSERTLQRIFPRVLDMMSKICAQFIYWPSVIDIKKNLPLSFRTNKDYSNVQSIIDCFEIEVEKPNNPIAQSATWSQYKGCNTIKFLIRATPDGFINFISKGYAGRITDVKLVEESGFLDIVQPNSVVLADRGFKHLESILQKKSVKLLRPPSVSANKKMTKMEAIESKVIASLRIHIERVIRRVRLYKFLKPHSTRLFCDSTINNKLVNCVDDAVVVACGLINLQSPIIKNI
ncbi:hypothetical protein ABMA27_003406 [Loxostege sticticalis]|uniref:DDE Tnp4 domain-containing protein n=1 Tax=Loxostege sticticalis TaxID=481309 RepID=A0ABR3HT02_LOXSC